MLNGQEVICSYKCRRKEILIPFELILQYYTRITRCFFILVLSTTFWLCSHNNVERIELFFLVNLTLVSQFSHNQNTVVVPTCRFHMIKIHHVTVTAQENRHMKCCGFVADA